MRVDENWDIHKMRKKAEPLKLSISKEALSKLPAAHFVGTITVIDKVDDIQPAIDTLNKAKIIGFDTETRPSFKKGQRNKVALIQLCDSTQCFLFRINKTGITPPLKELLENNGKIKVGLSLNDDFMNLKKVLDMKPAGFIDLQKYVKSSGILDNSLSRIYAIIFGQRISKNQRLSNWEAPTLTEHQQQYAALDALACIRIYDALSKNHFSPKDSQYIVDEDPYLPKPQPEKSTAE